MTESRQNRKEEEIFAVARAIASQDERREYLDQVCANDPETRREVEELLTIYDCERSFLESPPPDFQGSSSNDFATAEAPGTMIGPYKILEMIGEGGMGNVYLAEQIEPVHRKVALKIIKSGMDSKSVIARFDAERQALALMDHPNIAKFHDAGISESGSPYFVMEMVNGPTIVQFCQQNKLDLLAKLELFTQVCHGVQHAHQKGIIHRDLKPSNVLVALYDDHPVAKVIDFGVAKAMGEKLTDKTMFTRFGQLVGTLEYMSPEQAMLTQRDVDTRSDVYSLGAILYELLTGKPPFEKEKLSGDSLDEALRIIREEEPVKPSSRMSQLHDGNRQSGSAQLISSPTQSSMIPADLDWIVMKCLEKDRSRRYATTNDVVQDVQRYLNNEPVSAGPPTVSYRLEKFLHRNKVAISVATIVCVSLILGIGFSAWQAIRAYGAEQDANKANTVLSTTLANLQLEKQKANRQREMAETEQRRAANSLTYVVGTLQSPLSAERADTRIIDVLRDAAENVESEFSDDPIVAARILESIAETFTYLGRGADAIPTALRAREILTDKLGPSHPDTLEAFHYVYWAYRESPGFEHQRLKLFEEARRLDAICKRELEENDRASVRILLALADAATYKAKANILNFNFGITDERWGTNPDSLFLQALEAAQDWKNEDNKAEELEHVLEHVGNRYYTIGEYDKSLALYRDLLASLLGRFQPDHVRVLSVRAEICDLESVNGDHAGVLQSSRELLKRFEVKFGEHDRKTIYRRAEHSLITARCGGVQNAKDLALKVVEQANQLFENTPLYLMVLDKQADVFWELGEKDRAIEILDDRIERTQNITSWNEAASALNRFIYNNLDQKGDYQGKIKLLQHFMPQFESASLQENETEELQDWVFVLKASISDGYDQMDNFPEAIRASEDLRKFAEDAFGLNDVRSLIALRYQFEWNLRTERYADAKIIAKERVARIRKNFGNDKVLVADGVYWLGVSYYWNKQYDDAADSFREFIDLAHQKLGQDRGKPFTMDESLEFFRDKTDLTAERYFSGLANLVSTYATSGEYELAKPMVEKLVPFYFDIKETNAKAFVLRVGTTVAAQRIALFDRHQAENGNLSQAENTVQLLEQVIPDDRNELKKADQITGFNAYLLSEFLIRLERYQDAADILEVLFERQREDSKPDHSWNLAQPLLERFGYCQLKLNNLKEAKDSLTKFLSIIPQEDLEKISGCMARNELGAVLIELGDLEEGEKLLIEGAQALWQNRVEFPHKRWEAIEGLQRVVDYYIDKNDTENAEIWRAKQLDFENLSDNN